jgi:hypothetical protein
MIEVVVRDDAEANWIAEPGDPTTLLVLLAVAAAGPTAELLRVGAGRVSPRPRSGLSSPLVHRPRRTTRRINKR